MTNDDIQAFTRVLTDAFALQNRRVESSDLAYWFNALAGYDLRVISQALSDHVRDPDVGRYPVKPADVVRRIDGGGEMRALQAWSLVERTMRAIGPWQTVTFDDPAIHAVIVDLGGWIRLCETRTTEMPSVRTEFVRRFVAYLTRPLAVRDVPRALLGMGSIATSPRLAGNPDRALALWREGADSTIAAFPTADAWAQKGHQPLGAPRGATIGSETPHAPDQGDKTVGHASASAPGGGKEELSW